jgi:hypothetical protein
MTAYITSPFKPTPQLAVAGTPTYLIGSYNDRTAPTLGRIISDAAVTTTATIVFQIIEGNIPVSGSLITVVGAANSSNFNVTNVAVTVVSTSPEGVCTCTYAISSTSQGTLADAGLVIIPQPEVGETISAAYSSMPVARPFNNPNIQEGQSLSATLSLPSGGTLSGVTATVQGADFDVDGEYTDLFTLTSTGAAGNVYTYQSGQGADGTLAGSANLLNYRFYRIRLSAVTGSGKVVGKIEF